MIGNLKKSVRWRLSRRKKGRLHSLPSLKKWHHSRDNLKCLRLSKESRRPSEGDSYSNHQNREKRIKGPTALTRWSRDYMLPRRTVIGMRKRRSLELSLSRSSIQAALHEVPTITYNTTSFLWKTLLLKTVKIPVLSHRHFLSCEISMNAQTMEKFVTILSTSRPWSTRRTRRSASISSSTTWRWKRRLAMTTPSMNRQGRFSSTTLTSWRRK